MPVQARPVPSRPVPTRTVLDLSFLLNHASHVLATQMSAAMGEIGLTPRGYCVLFHALQAERTQIELAEIADLDKTTMVVTVDDMEKAGLAERRPSSADRHVLDALPTEQREVLTGALTRLVGGHLATPVDSARPVRRARQSRS